ncbi:hypothetical protein DIPPA_26502 [Diplonema papillatum]|nr:hypothetical protein DIPPA_26502 [Diplonema papillatum]
MSDKDGARCAAKSPFGLSASFGTLSSQNCFSSSFAGGSSSGGASPAAAGGGCAKLSPASKLSGSLLLADDGGGCKAATPEAWSPSCGREYTHQRIYGLDVPRSESPSVGADREVLGEFCGTGDFSDCIVRCEDGAEIPAHRIILAMSSRAFSAMLGGGFRESETCAIDIEASRPVAELFLKHVYTREIRITPDSALGQYLLADKYGFPELRAACFAVLVESLAEDTVFDVFRAKATPELEAACISEIACGDVDDLARATGFAELPEADLLHVMECLAERYQPSAEYLFRFAWRWTQHDEANRRCRPIWPCLLLGRPVARHDRHGRSVAQHDDVDPRDIRYMSLGLASAGAQPPAKPPLIDAGLLSMPTLVGKARTVLSPADHAALMQRRLLSSPPPSAAARRSQFSDSGALDCEGFPSDPHLRYACIRDCPQSIVEALLVRFMKQRSGQYWPVRYVFGAVVLTSASRPFIF